VIAAAALVAGIAVAVQLIYIAALRGQVADLHAQVCGYQQAAVRLEQALAARGVPQVTVPPPASCP
jgi:hypothetical protein